MKTFQVQVVEYHSEDDWTTVKAYDEEQAAEKYAELADSDGDYNIVRGNEIIAKVRENEDTPWKSFRVHGESVAAYYAREIK